METIEEEGLSGSIGCEGCRSCTRTSHTPSVPCLPHMLASASIWQIKTLSWDQGPATPKWESSAQIKETLVPPAGQTQQALLKAD